LQRLLGKKNLREGEGSQLEKGKEGGGYDKM
jgi:hypothetical protein